MRKKELKEISLKLSEGLLRTITDTVLFTFYLSMSSFGKPGTSRGTHRAFEEAEEALSEINYQTIKRAIFQLRKKGFVRYKRRYSQETLDITKEGIARLKELVPSYKSKRTWDGHVYLITYDIPEKQRYKREILRFFIIRLGGVKLQESVFLIPYNPRMSLKSFIEERNLRGVVIISDLGQDATIGEEDLKTLIGRLYHLNALNERYKEFIHTYKIERNSQFGDAATKYLSILRDDPQLPFELLSDDWRGDEAYKLFKRKYPALLA